MHLVQSSPGRFVADSGRGPIALVQGFEAPSAICMLGARVSQAADFPCSIPTLPFVTDAAVLQIGPHRSNHVAALQDQIVAQVESEQVYEGVDLELNSRYAVK